MSRLLISCFCDKTSESLQTVSLPPLTQPLFPPRVTGVNLDTVISLGKGHMAGDYSTGSINNAAACRPACLSLNDLLKQFGCCWLSHMFVIPDVEKDKPVPPWERLCCAGGGWTGSQHAVNLQLLRLTSAPVQQTTKEIHESLMVINL